jgi:hypothetical protein
LSHENKNNSEFWSVAIIKSNSAFLIKWNYERYFKKVLDGQIKEFYIPYIEYGSRKYLILPNYLCFKLTSDFDFKMWRLKESLICGYFFEDEEEGKLARIPDEEIERFKRNVELYKMKKESLFLEENNFVRIKEGVFMGYFGVIKKIDLERKRALILLEKFNVSLWIPIQYLELF